MGFIKGAAKLLGKAADYTYGTLAEALEDWKKNNPQDVESMQKMGVEVTEAVLKDPKYRGVRFDAGMPTGHTSVRIVAGDYCHTVGEYQDAIAKHYGPGGTHYEAF